MKRRVCCDPAGLYSKRPSTFVYTCDDHRSNQPFNAQLKNLIKGRNERLRQPETEYQLRPRHEQLRRQSLEEAGDTLVLHHATHDPESRLGILKVAVLYPRLDDV